jgi:hypothetical protein
MGREIRQVPLDWEHPKNERGHFRPLYDRTHEEALKEWNEEREAFNAKRPILHNGEPYEGTFEERHGEVPDPLYYRPAFPTTDGFQIYETVSEGTPVSPVFKTRDELRDWLIKQGTSPEAAKNFAEDGWVPSMVVGRGKIVSGYECANAFPRPEKE